MVLVDIDSSRRVLVIGAAGKVTANETADAARRVRQLLEEVGPGLVALTDFRWLESMASGSAPFVAEMMDVIAAKKAKAVVRVVPDPHKDIGLNILSQFHYGPDVRVLTFNTLADAIAAIASD